MFNSAAVRAQLGPPDACGHDTMSPDGRLSAAVRVTKVGSTLEIVTRVGRRVVFSRRLRRGYVQLQWSPNSSGLAVFSMQVDTPDVNRLITWRRGRRSLDIVGSATGFLAGEPLYSILWSPDGRKLLMHIPGAQGNYETHTGDLWCVNLDTRSLRLVNSGVTRVRWTGRRSVHYRYRPWLALPESPHRGPERRAIYRCQ